eukprot:1266892-Lingulodinium_polyedra.AAC.1
MPTCRALARKPSQPEAAAPLLGVAPAAWTREAILERIASGALPDEAPLIALRPAPPASPAPVREYRVRDRALEIFIQGQAVALKQLMAELGRKRANRWRSLFALW